MSIVNDDKSKEIQEEFENLNDLLNWNKRFLVIGGFWPLDHEKKTLVRATILTTYMTFHLFTEYAQLLAVVGDLDAIVLSILESTMQTMALAKLFVFRYSNMLREIILVMKEDYAEDNYANLEEKIIYLKYNNFSKWYFKLSVPYIAFAASLYYLRPLLFSLLMRDFGTNSSFALPFQTKLFFGIEDLQTYLMTYAWYMPMIYLLMCHNAWICVLMTIILHICGQLAIVEHRIKNINCDLVKNNEKNIFRSLVKRHERIVWMAKNFDNSFNYVLLIDLVGQTILLGLMSYISITGSEMTDKTLGYVYMICILATLFLIYGYCMVGETLIQDSIRVHEAFYQCDWYKSSEPFRKSLSICMVQTQQPLTMTAGKFFVFSLTGFTDILKSAMGYLSMLRKVSM